METVPNTLDTIFQGNESLSIIEIFEEALEQSLENLNISDTGKHYHVHKHCRITD